MKDSRLVLFVLFVLLLNYSISVPLDGFGSQSLECMRVPACRGGQAVKMRPEDTVLSLRPTSGIQSVLLDAFIAWVRGTRGKLPTQ